MRRVDSSIRTLVLGVLCFCPFIIWAADPSSPTVNRTFALDHNRLIVEVELLRPDGSLRKAKAWVDTGSHTLDVAETLALELGLEIPAFPQNGHTATSASRTPAISIGGLPLDAAGIKLQVHRGNRVMPGVPAELNLPARVLLNYFVVFDYPGQRLTVAPPGTVEPRGTLVPCRIHPDTGLFQITVPVEGEQVQMAVDNGSAGTWVSEALANVWTARHPGWSTSRGAAGSTNFFGFPFELKGLLLRLPELQIGSATVRGVGVLGLHQGLFDWYSTKTVYPVQGFLGANVLKDFRLEVDYPKQMTYWTLGRSTPEPFFQVGITLRPLPDGRYMIAGILERAGKPCVDGAEAGDVLLRVDSLAVSNLSMGGVMKALQGKPGEFRTLHLEREGRPVKIKTKVSRLI